MKLSKCTCGYGSGWYHNESGTTHEFNPYVTEIQATDRFWRNRQALGLFYEHISNYILASINRYEKNASHTITSKKFDFKKYNSEKAAKKAAAEWVMNKVINENKIAPIKEVQMELFT